AAGNLQRRGVVDDLEAVDVEPGHVGRAQWDDQLEPDDADREAREREARRELHPEAARLEREADLLHAHRAEGALYGDPDARPLGRIDGEHAGPLPHGRE